MSQQLYQDQSSNTADQVLIRTEGQRWVIPYNCALLKLLIEQQGIQAEDLCFSSQKQCKKFIQELLLLALEDEVKSCQPSPLAPFARSLMQCSGRH